MKTKKFVAKAASTHPKELVMKKKIPTSDTDPKPQAWTYMSQSNHPLHQLLTMVAKEAARRPWEEAKNGTTGVDVTTEQLLHGEPAKKPRKKAGKKVAKPKKRATHK
jgi:hypothetical protein